MNAFELLRSDGKTEFQFETLVLRYRRLTRDYATVARGMLADPTLWDGGGKGASHRSYLKIMELEQKREGVRVAVLGDLLNSVEVAGDDMPKVHELVINFAVDRSLDPNLALVALQSEVLRRMVCEGVTAVKQAYGDAMGPYSDQGPSERQILAAQKILRHAVELDEK